MLKAVSRQEVFHLTAPNNRFHGIVALLSILLLLSSFSMFMLETGKDADTANAAPTRAEKYYLEEQDIFIPNAESKENLYLISWVENTETYVGQDHTSGEYSFNYRTIANSFSMKIDGSSQSSGSTRRVFAELFTALDCPYCPGAEGSLDIIADTRNPNEMTLISWHVALNAGGDHLQTIYSESRQSAYTVDGIAKPTVIFDGERALVGGSQSASAPDLVNSYNKEINKGLSEPAMVSLSGSGTTYGDNVSFNASFQMINPMPKGDWAFKVAVCEDLRSLHNGAEIRFVPRFVKSMRVRGLHEGFPDVILDEEDMFEGLDKDDIHGELDILWSANDPEDGANVEIDILKSINGGEWDIIASELANSGSYTWDTMNPRSPDGMYELRVLARDTSGNEVLSSDTARFYLNNRDPPVGEITVPGSLGDSLGGRITFKWNSSDDEDELGQLDERVSISEDLGATFDVITLDASGWETNDGRFEINSLNYPDLDTYILKVELRDRDGMITSVLSNQFEIYNNDAPVPSLLTPEFKETVTGELEISWQVEDQEDQAWGLLAVISGNFSVKKEGTDEWIELFNGELDEESGSGVKTFDTSALAGDGDYILRFTAKDSRGRKAWVNREFSVYDPDEPEFTEPLKVPKTADDHRSSTFTFSWNAVDADEDETIRYTIEISPVIETNWTVIADKILESSYDLDLSGLEEGRYKLRITATDSSSYKLSSQIEYGPFMWNAPDPPQVEFLSPFEGFNGVIEDDTGMGNLTGFLNYMVLWGGSDKDNDNLTYTIYFKKEADDDWTKLEDGLEMGVYLWNISGYKDGSYLLRVVAVDDSDEAFSGEAIIGPFTLDMPWDPVPAVDDDDDITGDDDDDSTDEGLDFGVMAIIAVMAVVIVLLVVGGVLFAISRSKAKKKEDLPPAVPDEGDVDLTSIPDFDRPAAPPAQIIQEPAAPGAVPMQQQMVDQSIQQGVPPQIQQLQQSAAVPEAMQQQSTQSQIPPSGSPFQGQVQVPPGPPPDLP